MPINAHPEYFKVEKEYLNAQTIEDKIYWLEELIRVAPKHKGSENLLAELREVLPIVLKDNAPVISYRAVYESGNNMTEFTIEDPT